MTGLSCGNPASTRCSTPPKLTPGPLGEPTELSKGCVKGVPQSHKAPFDADSFIEAELVAQNCPPELKEALRNISQQLAPAFDLQLVGVLDRWSRPSLQFCLGYDLCCP